MSCEESLRFSVSLGLPEDAARIRREVFMDEQGFVNEFDDLDPVSTHIVAYAGGEPAGTCRIIPEEGGECALGRLAVLRSYRGSGVGSEIVREAERVAASMGFDCISLSAQVRVRGFYESLGYVAHGDEYLDEYCPHVTMRKRL